MPTASFDDIDTEQPQPSGGTASFDDIVQPSSGTASFDDIAQVVPASQPTPTESLTPQTDSILSQIEAFAKKPSPPWLQKPEQAIREYVTGMVPKTREQAARMAGIPTDWTDPKQVLGFMYPPLRPGLELPEAIQNRAQQIQAAEQTPPFSQERWTAGIGTVADIAQMAGIVGGAKGLGRPREIPAAIPKEPVPIEPKIEGEINAIQSSNAQVPPRGITQRVQAGTEGNVPPASYSDYAQREAQGAVAGRELPQEPVVGAETPPAQGEVAQPEIPIASKEVPGTVYEKPVETAPETAPERPMTFTEEQNLSANLSRAAEGEKPLRPKAQIEEAVGLRPISEVNQTIESVRRNMVTKEAAFTERLRGMQAGSEIGSKAMKQNLQMADKWLEADRDAIRTDLLSFSKNLPLNERAKFLPTITSALKRPSILTKDPAQMYRRAEDVLNRMTEKVYEVHKTDRTAAIENLLERVEKSPSITITEKQAIRQRGKFFNNMKDKMSLDMLDQMNANLAETERLGRDLYALDKTIQAERVNATLNEITQQGVRKIELPQQYRPVLGQTQVYWDKKMDSLRRVPELSNHFNMAVTPVDWWIQTFDMRPEGALYRTFRVPTDVKFGEYLNLKDAYQQRLIEAANKYKLNEGNMNRIQAHAELRQEGGLENLQALGYTDAEIASARTLSRPELEYLREADKINTELYPIVRDVLKEHFNQEIGPKVAGYFPRIRDWDYYNSLSIEEGRFAEGFKRASTKAGATIERTGATTKNITNAHDIMFKHIDDMLYHAKVGPEIRRIADVIKTDQFKNQVGSWGQRQFSDWVDVLSRNGGVARGRTNYVFDWLRKNTGVGQLAFRLTTIGLQPLSIINGMALTSPKNVAIALSKMADKVHRDFVIRNMPEVRHRIGDDPALTGYTGKSVRDVIARAGFKPISVLDRFAAITIAEAAYRDNLAARGIPFDLNRPDPTAIQYAQYIVRKTQSSPYAKDVPLSISRGNLIGNKSVEAALFQFQNYLINKWALLKNGALQMGIKEKSPVTGARIMAFMILGTIAEQLGRDGIMRAKQALLGKTQYDEKREKEGKSYARQIGEKTFQDLVTSMPGVTNINGIIQYEGTGIPILDVGRDIAMEGGKVITGKQPATKITGGIRAVQGIGSAMGFPTSQAGDIAVQAVRSKMKKSKKAKMLPP